MRPNFKDITGQRIGHLTVLKFVRTDKTKHGSPTVWLCRCVCGVEREYAKPMLLRRVIRSCGCRQHERNKRISEEEYVFNQVTNSYKQNAKKKKLEWSLTKEQIRTLFQSPCAYCGRQGDSKCFHNSPVWYTGIDRVNNHEGYTHSNCAPCCKTCNRAKHTLPLELWNTYLDSIFVSKAVHAGTITHKAWGTETLLCNSTDYCAKFLRINPGFQCSLHRHDVKREEFLVLQGTVVVEVGTQKRTMCPGDRQDILSGTFHRFGSIGGALLHETSTHHSDDDVVRLEESRKME